MHNFIHQLHEAVKALLSFSQTRHNLQIVFFDFFVSGKIRNIGPNIVNEFRISQIGSLLAIIEENELKSFREITKGSSRFQLLIVK
jgi:hypothetical protein